MGDRYALVRYSNAWAIWDTANARYVNDDNGEVWTFHDKASALVILRYLNNGN
jgi:hypothetical protein